MNWCLYHSEQAQFLGPVTETRMPGPAGRYSCCGQQAFRYETLPGPMVNEKKKKNTSARFNVNEDCSRNVIVRIYRAVNIVNILFKYSTIGIGPF